MNKNYQTPAIEIVRFETENVLDMSVYVPTGNKGNITPIIPIRCVALFIVLQIIDYHHCFCSCIFLHT